MKLSDLSDAQLEALMAQKTDPNIQAINSIESGGKGMTANPVNPASGASSNMQTMKATAANPGYGVKPSDGTPVDNSRVGTEYYDKMLKEYGDPVKAAVAYNWGPGNANKWIANGAKLADLPDETLDYVNKFVNHPARQAPAQPTLPQGATEINPQIVEEQAPLPKGNTPEYTIGGRIQQGVMDFLGGAGRAVVTGINKLSPSKENEALLAQTDALTKQRDAEFAQKRAATGADPNSTDWARVGGQVLPQFLIPGTGATGITARMLEGAGQGALGAAAMTKPGESYGQNMALGGAVGGAATGLVNAAGKVIGGAKLSKNAQTLVDQGVTPTPGQALGGVYKTVEERAGSVPGLGDAIRSGERSAVRDMNIAAYQKVLDPIGETAPKAVGREAIEDISNKISDKYDEILPKITFKIDTQLKRDMAPIYQAASDLPPDMQDAFESIVNRNIASQLKNGEMSGEAFKRVDSALGAKIRNLTTSSDAFQRDLGEVLKQTQVAMRDAVERTNPNVPELPAANRAWRNLLVLQNAGARVMNPENPIMPGQLQAAVKAQNATRGKAGFAKGQANMQELSDPAAAVLGSRVPDSGTAGRLMMGAGLGGMAGLISPGALAAALAGAGLYGTQAGRKAMFAALARRPEFAKALGEALQGASPAAGGAIGSQYPQAQQ